MAKEKWRTSDGNLAAYILMKGMAVNLEAMSGRQEVFVLFAVQQSPELDEAISDYRRNVPVPVLDFSHARRVLADQMNRIKYKEGFRLKLKRRTE